MNKEKSMTNLAVDVFLTLSMLFFDADGNPKRFSLREKRNTQDDPLDEHIADQLEKRLDDAVCKKAPGPLITPDLIVFRPELCENVSPSILRNDLTRILAVEVKKIERSERGTVARSSGLDYNTTPPCGTVRVYDENDNPLDIKAFYLFVCQERRGKGTYEITAMTLCDGDVLNEDFDLYLKITSQREKRVGLGTYGNGVDRIRPMLIFSNPLGSHHLDKKSTIITKKDISGEEKRLKSIYRIIRETKEGEEKTYFAYKKKDDERSYGEVREIREPFPRPAKRESRTQRRGIFRLPIRPKNRNK